jgi:hypothetical protein
VATDKSVPILIFFVGFGEEVEAIPYMVMSFSKIVYGVQDLAEKILLEF